TLDEALDGRLDQRVEAILRLDHEGAVPERLGDLPVRGAAHHLIDGVEAEPHRELEGEVRPSTRQPACLRVARHSTTILTRRPAGPVGVPVSRSPRATEEGWNGRF